MNLRLFVKINRNINAIKLVDIVIFIYLSNRVLALDDGQNSLGLNRGRFLETVGVDSTENLFFESHIVKFVNFHIPVCFEKFFSFLS